MPKLEGASPGRHRFCRRHVSWNVAPASQSVLAEIGGGECGEDVYNEVKCFAFAKKGDTPGKGSRGTSDTVCPATGHMIGFGNTEEECRLQNLGCRERGRPSDGPFDPKTGKGHVKKKKGRLPRRAVQQEEPR